MMPERPYDPNPNARRKRTDFNAPKPNELEARREEQLAALERMQAERPLKPPGVRRG